MRSKCSGRDRASRRFIVVLCVGAASAAGLGPASAGGDPPLPDPTDATTPVPPTVYRGALPEAASGYLGAVDKDRLPWRELFRPDGSFAPEPGQGAGAGRAPVAAAHPQHAHAARPADGASDARGVVQGLDPQQGKVKLKHGPIEKLDMPGMTMMFRVKDPRLLEQVREGDEVGFTIEVEGSTFYVTGFQR